MIIDGNAVDYQARTSPGAAVYIGWKSVLWEAGDSRVGYSAGQSGAG